MNFATRHTPHATRHTVRTYGFLSILAAVTLSGCNPNNNQNINTAVAKVMTGGTVVSTPLGSQLVVANWQSDIYGGSNPPYGSTYSFQGVTTTYTPGQPLFPVWPTFLSSTNDRMPAYWVVQWAHPPYCVSQTPPYGLLQNPFSSTYDFEPTSNTDPYGPNLDLLCFTNSPANPGFVPSNVYPQFALDDQLPTTIQVATLAPVTAAPSVTNLHIFGTDLSNPANVSAISVENNGSSATFPYPRETNGTSLPAGAYVVTMTTDASGSPQTTNAMEAFYIAHDDTSYTGSYGVAVISPIQHTVTKQGILSQRGVCSSYATTTSQTGGAIPLVTLITQGQLAIGSSTNTVNVGTSPTVVLPVNSHKQIGTYNNPDTCEIDTTTYTGAESAFVVNTGSNNVSVVQVGPWQYPAGTVSVGGQPVAAAVSPDGSMVYVANYGDGTVSEVSLALLQQTRTIAVMAHPTSLTFDSNGNLWVGGQGAVMNVNVGAWSIASNVPVDGTVNGMSYDMASGMLIQTILQNGSAANLSEGATGSSAINFSVSPNASYTTQNVYNPATGASSVFAGAVSDNAPYSLSNVSSLLAFPGQTAFSPPIYTASSGDITATVSGNSFTVCVVGTNQVLIQGMLPFPARSVALTANTVYFTMPDTNSLVSLPMQLP